MSLRLFKIVWVVTRHRLDTLIPAERLPLWMRLLLKLSPLQLVPLGQRSRGERLRLALEALGPIFIKFGQMLSTRRDLLPEDIADELKRLQDQVPPFPGELAAARVENELEMTLAEAFAAFDRVPLASASIAQVHAATLHSGEDVVVKIIRPSIDRIMRQDMGLCRSNPRLRGDTVRRAGPLQRGRQYLAAQA